MSSISHFNLDMGVLRYSSYSLDSSITRLGSIINCYSLFFRMKDKREEYFTSLFDEAKFHNDVTLRQKLCNGMTLLVKNVIEYESLQDRKIYIISAIGHDSQKLAHDSFVMRITEQVSNELQIASLDRFITKKVTAELKMIKTGGTSRDAAIEGAYSIENNLRFPNAPVIFIFDDICTRGSTMIEISNCIIRTYPKLSAEFIFFTVAKEESSSYWSSRHVTISNEFLGQEYQSLLT